MKCILIALSILSALVMSANAEERTPQIELNCEKVGGVVFTDDGRLIGAGVDADFVDYTDGMLRFTHGVTLAGKVERDAVMFDKSVLSIGVNHFACTAE